MGSRQRIGQWGEQVAAAYLVQRGFEILGCNVRTPYGELDVIARLEKLIVFVEVKTRTGTGMGMPENGVTAAKQAHLLSAAEHFLQTHPEIDADCRMDVIAVIGSVDVVMGDSDR
jgi:putative endonuclease